MNNEQRGVALLIVLMLLALMAALAADMTLSFHSQLQRTRQVNHHLQRQYDIELAEKLALASLTQDVKDNDRQTDHVAAVLGTATTVAAGRWQYSEVAVTRCPALF